MTPVAKNSIIPRRNDDDRHDRIPSRTEAATIRPHSRVTPSHTTGRFGPIALAMASGIAPLKKKEEDNRMRVKQ